MTLNAATTSDRGCRTSGDGPFAAARKRVLTTTFGTETARIDLLPPHRRARGLDLFTGVAFRIDDAEGVLFLPPGLLARAWDQLAPGLSRHSLEPDIAALLFEVVLAPALDALEQHLGCRVRVGSVLSRAEAAPHIATVNLGLRFAPETGPPAHLGVSVPPALAARITAAWPDADGAHDEIDVVSRAGWAIIDRSFTSLKAGDVVVLQQSALTAGRVALIADGRAVALGALEDRGVILDGPFAEFGATFSDQFVRGVRRGPKLMNGAHVVCDLARSRMRTSDIAALEAGSLIEMPHSLSVPVVLAADDGATASGLLVRVGARIGVRLLESSP